MAGFAMHRDAPLWQRRLGYALLLAEKYPAAIEQLAPLVGGTKDADALGDVQYWLATSYFKQQAFDKALAACEASLSAAPEGGRGSLIDISSPIDILINQSGTGGGPGTLTLSASKLSGFNAESLLIGGLRTFGSGSNAGTATVSVATGNITVDTRGPGMTGNLRITGRVLEQTTSQHLHGRLRQQPYRLSAGDAYRDRHIL